MKTVLATLLSILIPLSFIIIPTTFGHPGRYSWDGCHYCWTRCSYWGYTYGTRHCKAGKIPKFGKADPRYYYYK